MRTTSSHNIMIIVGVQVLVAVRTNEDLVLLATTTLSASTHSTRLFGLTRSIITQRYYCDVTESCRGCRLDRLLFATYTTIRPEEFRKSQSTIKVYMQ